MAGDDFIEAIQGVIVAARMFLDTDAAFGADDRRTRRQKEQLARALAALMRDDVDDAPQVHVIRGGLDEDRG